jgi:ABC-type uncharacterized transport system substrate-binding protein
MNSEPANRRIELLREAFPRTRRVAILYQSDFDMNARQAKEAESATKRLGFGLLAISVGATDVIPEFRSVTV